MRAAISGSDDEPACSPPSSAAAGRPTRNVLRTIRVRRAEGGHGRRGRSHPAPQCRRGLAGEAGVHIKAVADLLGPLVDRRHRGRLRAHHVTSTARSAVDTLGRSTRAVIGLCNRRWLSTGHFSNINRGGPGSLRNRL